MNRSDRALTPLMLLAALLLGCGDSHHTQSSPTAAIEAPEPQQEGRGTVRLNVTFAPWRPGAAKAADINAIDRATAYVYSPDGAEIARRDLDLSDGVARGRVTVRVAEGLRVTVVLYDGALVRYVGVDTDVDVAIGRESAADVVCHYMGTWVQVPEVVGADRSYSVSWASRPHATGYELQEAESSDFSDPVTVYEGAALSREMPGKSQIGLIYHYRARAGTGYGVGPWHSTGAAVVEIRKAEGDVVVEFPIPSDEPETQPLPDAMAYYPFNGNADDESGNGHHGEVHGAVLTEDRYGQAESAYYFDGQDDSILIPDYAAFNGMAAFTLAAWLQTAVPGSEREGGCIISKVTPNRDFFLSVRHWDALQLAFAWGAEYQECITQDAVPVGSWCHAVGVWDGQEQRVYLNGTLAATQRPAADVIPPMTGTIMQIGRLAGHDHFWGALDEVRIYNRALDDTEIWALYGGG